MITPSYPNGSETVSSNMQSLTLSAQPKALQLDSRPLLQIHRDGEREVAEFRHPRLVLFEKVLKDEK